MVINNFVIRYLCIRKKKLRVTITVMRFIEYNLQGDTYVYYYRPGPDSRTTDFF